MLIQNLSFSFGKNVIFQDLNMEFEPGLITGVVGRNGVGKTTLFRLIKGIYKARAGNILLAEQALVGQQVGFLQTDPYFYPFMKGREYLELILKSKDKLQKYGQVFDLPLDELIDNYSTGMKKKLAFAGILGLDKAVCILDEPFNGVDLQSNYILKHFIKAKSENRITVISSHILETMLDLCDVIYFIEEKFEYQRFVKDQFVEMQEKIKDSMIRNIEL